jgi:tetratricopeptide (TPR) repeat protein
MVSRRRIDARPWLAALVVAAALAAFAPALDNGFVGWDDDLYLVDNPAFRGLGLKQLRWAFTTALGGLYQPLTWLSFSIDHALWGMQPWGYHLTNILLHALAACLFFEVCRELFEKTGAPARAALLGATVGALAFAVNPLRVESVAWAVERKDVLAGVFWIASLLAYVRGRARPALLCFAASLLAKGSGLALPAVLLVLDIYPLRRLHGDPRRWSAPAARAVLLEKAPFAVVAIASSLTTLSVISRGGILHVGDHGWAFSLCQTLYGLWYYPLKSLRPWPLLPYYPPKPWFGRLTLESVGLAAATVAAAAWAWGARRRRPAVLAALACYALIAAPTLGVIHAGLPFAAADRYGYLPSLALCALLGGAVSAAEAPMPVLAAVAAVLSVWGALSWRQTAVWRDSRSLWSAELAEEPRSLLGLNNLGAFEAEAGRYAQALPLLQRAAEQLDYAEAQANLGMTLLGLGRAAEAEGPLRRALALKPELSGVRVKLGVLLAGNPASRLEAEVLFRAALAAGQPGAARELAALDQSRGRMREALQGYEAAVAADPADGAALNNMGLLLDGQGRSGQARDCYRRALRTPAWRSTAHYNLGNLLLAAGRADEAAFHYRSALLLDPRLARAHVNWGNLLARRGRFGEAAAHYRAALEKDPRLVEARVNLSAVQRFLKR